MIVDQTIQFVHLHSSEIVLFLTFCAICWYSWETRRLVASSDATTRMIAIAATLQYTVQEQKHLCDMSQVASRPEILGHKIGDCVERINKIKKELELFLC